MTAVVVAAFTWADGSTLSITVQVSDSYPDALNQARSEAVRGVTEAVTKLAEDD